MSKHTPGPWTFHEACGDRWQVDALDFRGCRGHVAEIDRRYDENGNIEDEANARLIAAAPKLLKALDDITNAYLLYRSQHEQHFAARDNCNAIKQSREVIAEATGVDDVPNQA